MVKSEERVIISAIICVTIITVAKFASQAFSAEAILPIRSEIVQCGKRSELEQACQRDARCCRLIEAAAGPGVEVPDDVRLESIWLGGEPVADVMVTDNE